jgi:LPXTG-site transpeptidase (sortase) family protein
MRAVINILTKIPLVIRVVSLYSIVGIASFCASLLIPNTVPAVAQTTTPVVPKQRILSQEIISGKPVRFSVERLKIDLPVRDGVYDAQTQEWTLSNDAVYFATITAQPNDNRGNTFIYGHNQDAVIGRMQDVTVGDVVVIQTDNNTFRYAYSHDSIVKPDFTAALSATSDTPQLTVMTCEGIWSSERRLMYFTLVEVF